MGKKNKNKRSKASKPPAPKVLEPTPVPPKEEETTAPAPEAETLEDVLDKPTKDGEQKAWSDGDDENDTSEDPITPADVKGGADSKEDAENGGDSEARKTDTTNAPDAASDADDKDEVEQPELSKAEPAPEKDDPTLQEPESDASAKVDDAAPKEADDASAKSDDTLEETGDAPAKSDDAAKQADDAPAKAEATPTEPDTAPNASNASTKEVESSGIEEEGATSESDDGVKPAELEEAPKEDGQENGKVEDLPEDDDDSEEEDDVEEEEEEDAEEVPTKEVEAASVGDDETDDTDGEEEDAEEEEDGNESEDEYDDDEDDEEDEEPVLKYERVKNRVPEILGKDSATAMDVSPRVVALGTQNGMVHVLTYEGNKVNSFRPHAANVTALRLDEDNDFVATASMEGRVVIHSLTSTESYAFDYKRPMNAIALEPDFAKSKSRRFVCGGMLGNLVLQEKGWLGYREQILHSGEGPIWAIEWRGNLIAWANDHGVKIYDTVSQQRIGYIDRGHNAPRAELFKPTLVWRDDRTLVIGWADYVKVVRVRNRPKGQQGLPPLSVEVLSVYEVDCMVAGLAPYHTSGNVILAYIPPDTYENEATQDRAEQRRKAANRPELRIIDKGDEIAADELAVNSYERYSCNDYHLAASKRQDDVDVFLVLTPSDLVMVRPRDAADHIDWLVGRERYEEALTAAEELQAKHGGAFDVQAIGLKYMRHLVSEGNFEQSASLAPKVLRDDAELWENWVYKFSKYNHLEDIISRIPVEDPTLSPDVYEMVLNHLLLNDNTKLLSTVKAWPTNVYDSDKVVSAVQSELGGSKDDPVLIEVLAELYIGRQQPARALPYYLRLRKPHVFDLIREYNLFDAVRDQALLLIEFDQERIKADPSAKEGKHGAAIELLVDHALAIPVDRVVAQLRQKPQYLYMYLDGLFEKDPQSCQAYSDEMVSLYASYDPHRLMPFLRASNFYDLERALRICEEHDYVHETVFLLGRMGNNLKALHLIIERLGDVRLAIEFAEEQRDDDLWEALLAHSETRPEFIRALLEHGGTEINPVRLIQRIKEGLEIPGLKPALVKVLQQSNLSVTLLEGCQRILNGDCSTLAVALQKAQVTGSHATPSSTCAVCARPLFTPTHPGSEPLVLVYLCRHSVHASCALLNEDVELPERPENAQALRLLLSDNSGSAAHLSVQRAQQRALGSKLSYEAMVRVRVGSCPVCAHAKGRRERVTVVPGRPILA